MTEQQTTTRVVQIIPAGEWGWYIDPGRMFPLAAWGLTDAGELVGLYADETGATMPVTEFPDFQGYVHLGDE